MSSAAKIARGGTCFFVFVGFSFMATQAIAGPDGCDVDGDVAICTGDQGDGVIAGVDFPSSVVFLKVKPDEGPIAPGAGTPGIYDVFDTTLWLKSRADIFATDADAIAIEGPGTLWLDSRGDLIADRRGIYAFSWEDAVYVKSDGYINAGEDGIFAQAITGVGVTNRGDIDAGFKGIFANAFAGPVTVNNDSAITADLDAIWAQGQGDVNIWNEGTLVSTEFNGSGYGIFANSTENQVFIYNDADITADLDPIWARGFTGVTVYNDANLTNRDGTVARGIYAESPIGFVNVTSYGTIDAGLDAIFARGVGAVSVEAHGTLNSFDDSNCCANGYGIYAESQASTVLVNNYADIYSDLDGIFAKGAADVTVMNTGDIMPNTSETNNRGIHAESLGGQISVYNTGDIDARLDSIFAKGTESVEVINHGDLTGFGSNSKGIYAQSLFNDVTVSNTGEISSHLEAIHAHAIGDVTITNDGGEITSAAQTALFAQSLNGAVEIHTSGPILSEETLVANEALFASGFTGVEIYNDGAVTSNSFRAIYAESDIGDITIMSTGDIQALGTNGNNGEAIFVDNEDAVTVHTEGLLTSTEFRGVFLQSRNSTLDFYSNGTVHAAWEGLFLSGNNVDATVMGDVTSDEWRGILATRSIGENPDGTIYLTYGGGTVQSNGSALGTTSGIEVDAFGGSSFITILGDGVVTGGSNTDTSFGSFGIYFKDGSNTLTNWGEINDDNGGHALGGADGDEMIYNHGLVAGSIYLGGGFNSFYNETDGLFETGDEIDIGVGNVVYNWGTLSPGGADTYQTTTFLSGDLEQSGPGELLIDIDFDTPAMADLIADVGTANMGGFVRANVQDLNLTYGASQTATILTATTVNDDGITGAAQGAVEVDVTTTATTVDITVGLNYAANGLEGNQAGMGDYLQGFFMGGVPGPLQSTFLDLAEVPTTAGYGAAISALGPEGFGGLAFTSLDANETFTNNLFSCPTLTGADRFSYDGQCAWAVAQTRHTDRDSSGGDLGYSDTAYSIAAGVQKRLADSWRLGFGLGYESGSYDSGTTSADRNLLNVGVVVKNKYANYDVALALTGGGQEADVSRFIPVPGATATSDQTLYFAALTGKVGRTFGLGANSYVKPFVEAGVTWLHRNSFTESGAGALNLSVDSEDDFIFRVAPTIEVGTEVALSDAIVAHPFARVGASVYSGDSSITGGFASLSPTVTLPVEHDTLYADVAVGVDFLAIGGGWSLQALYEGRFSENDTSNAGLLKARINF